MVQKRVFCRSSSVVKNGLRKRNIRTKQSYLCLSCKKQFVEPDGFERMQYKPEIIVRAVNMHNDGLSLFQVQNHLWQHDGVKVSRETIRVWCKKFGIFLKPDKKSGAKAFRATALRRKVRESQRKDYYDLNCIDTRTKFITAHLFVEKRSFENCVTFLSQIKNSCYNQILAKYYLKKYTKIDERILFVCDGFENYKNAFNNLFYRAAKLQFGVPIACKKYELEHNNNPIER